MEYIDRAVDPQMLLTPEAGDDDARPVSDGFAGPHERFRPPVVAFSPVPGSRVSPVQTRVTQENPRAIQTDETRTSC